LKFVLPSVNRERHVVATTGGKADKREKVRGEESHAGCGGSRLKA